jgi:adenosylmethionine-8-amino-7-oxononanoate aminotransferase
MLLDNQSLIQRDLAVLWHPCSQMKDHEQVPLIPIKSGQGVWLEDFEGNRYLDAISSWWVNLFGHANPLINQALKQQLDTLEHVILGGFTHQAALELAEKLVEITPTGLNKCFYADNGSSAVEIALKMSFHYWRNLGQTQKTKFITLENSYHGETLGALAVGNVALYKETYGPLLMDVITVLGRLLFSGEWRNMGGLFDSAFCRYGAGFGATCRISLCSDCRTAGAMCRQYAHVPSDLFKNAARSL